MNGKVLLFAQQVILRVALAFALAQVVQWLLLIIGCFGDRPVIVVSFFVCLNLLFLLAVLPTILFGLLVQLREKAFLWRVLIASIVAGLSVASAVQQWVVYLT